MARAKLTVVADESGPEERKHPSVAEAAATGDHRALLVAMRERIAHTVSRESCPPRDLAALTRRLQDIAERIEEIDFRAREEGADSAGLPEDEEWSADSL